MNYLVKDFANLSVNISKLNIQGVGFWWTDQEIQF